MALPVVEVVCAEVPVEGVILEHGVDGGRHRSGDCPDRRLWAAREANAQVLRLEVSSLAAQSRPGALDESGL